MNPVELKLAFGRRVQALREARGLTQEQLAEQIDRTVDTVGNIERGTNSTRVETAARISDALGVDLPELFEFAEAPGLGRRRRREIAEMTRLLAAQDERIFASVVQLIRSALSLAEGGKS